MFAGGHVPRTSTNRTPFSLNDRGIVWVSAWGMMYCVCVPNGSGSVISSGRANGSTCLNAPSSKTIRLSKPGSYSIRVVSVIAGEKANGRNAPWLMRMVSIDSSRSCA